MQMAVQLVDKSVALQIQQIRSELTVSTIHCFGRI